VQAADEIVTMILQHDFANYLKNATQPINSKSSLRESLQEKIQHLIDCGSTPRKAISYIMLNQKYVDPILLRIGELQWVMYLHDPEIGAIAIMKMDKTELAARCRIA
jgi:hypothetical protein